MNRIDATRPDSPALAGPGAYPVGVAAQVIEDPARFDPYTGITGPRLLPAEVWYPANAATVAGVAYHTILRDGLTPVTLHGRACRGAMPAAGRFPLVVISHGYPGNRYLLAHLAEALASQGYVVVAVDHPQSTYDDQGSFGATLYHRPLDQRRVLAAMAGDRRVLPGCSALIGFSMGGYGALVTAGAGIAAAFVGHELAPPGGALAVHAEGQATAPEGLRAVIAIGPWGMGRGLWTAATLAGLSLPLLVMAGSVDETSDYAGMRAIAEGAVQADRWLLSAVNAGHNAFAPIPAPAESHAFSEALGWAPFSHYADPVWDTVRLNALAQHFATAFLDRHLKGDATRAALLDPATALGPAGGFTPETAVGLQLEAWRGGETPPPGS